MLWQLVEGVFPIIAHRLHRTRLREMAEVPITRHNLFDVQTPRVDATQDTVGGTDLVTSELPPTLRRDVSVNAVNELVKLVLIIFALQMQMA